jgi:hypothetical protein
MADRKRGLDRIVALVRAIWRRGRPDVLLHHSDRAGNIPASTMADHGEEADYGVAGSVATSLLTEFRYD